MFFKSIFLRKNFATPPPKKKKKKGKDLLSGQGHNSLCHGCPGCAYPRSVLKWFGMKTSALILQAAASNCSLHLDSGCPVCEHICLASNKLPHQGQPWTISRGPACSSTNHPTSMFIESCMTMKIKRIQDGSEGKNVSMSLSQLFQGYLVLEFSKLTGSSSRIFLPMS